MTHPIHNCAPNMTWPSWTEYMASALEADAKILDEIAGRFRGTYRDLMVNDFARPLDSNPTPSDEGLDFVLSNGNGTGIWGRAQAAIEIAEHLVWEVYGEIIKYRDRLEGE